VSDPDAGAPVVDAGDPAAPENGAVGNSQSAPTLKNKSSKKLLIASLVCNALLVGAFAATAVVLYKMDERLDTVAEQAAEPGPPGPRGERGPAGPEGPRGVDGEDGGMCQFGFPVRMMVVTGVRSGIFPGDPIRVTMDTIEVCR
jgi:hypothetical protein